MDNDKKSMLQIELEKAGIKPRAYSGRHMYGEYCLAVDVDSIGELAQWGLPKVADFMRDMTIMKSDSMGLGFVVYFPGVPFVDDKDEP
jgi:hypothetical protein